MNKELCTVLRDRLASLPFIDVLAGMVQTVTTESYTDDSKKYIYKYPVSYDVLGNPDCTISKEKDLQPDSSKRSIIYFEDYGTTALEIHPGHGSYVSNVRLVAWLNRGLLTGNKYSEITGICVQSIIKKLKGSAPINSGIFTKLIVKPTKIPAQDAAIFGKYSYYEPVRQYLRPPFEFFAIDFVCSYQINNYCLIAQDFNNPNNCVK